MMDTKADQIRATVKNATFAIGALVDGDYGLASYFFELASNGAKGVACDPECWVPPNKECGASEQQDDHPAILPFI